MTKATVHAPEFWLQQARHSEGGVVEEMLAHAALFQTAHPDADVGQVLNDMMWRLLGPSITAHLLPGARRLIAAEQAESGIALSCREALQRSKAFAGADGLLNYVVDLLERDQ